MFEVETPSISPATFRSVLSPQRIEAFEQGVRQARRLTTCHRSEAGILLDSLRLIRCVPERSGVRAAA